MLRRKMLVGLALGALAACSGSTSARIGPDGLPLPQVYKISPSDTGDIQFRMLDSVNALRQAAGVPPVELDGQLTAAAATHSRDMSIQNRPWLFGSDGSSPLDRALRAGFQGQIVGENISESYETELETLAAWINQTDTRNVILDPKRAVWGSLGSKNQQVSCGGRSTWVQTSQWYHRASPHFRGQFLRLPIKGR